jgi:P-type Ca2+ transporter type 2C
VDPAAENLMDAPPRPAGEPVITRQMWRGIALVGAVMAIGTLFVLDASLPGGFVPGTGDLAYAQTRAFTTLVFFQLFNVFNARSDVQSAFHNLFRNRWLWASVGLSSLLQVAVVYVSLLRDAFGTVSLGPSDWVLCIAVASWVLWIREAAKMITRARESRLRVE